VLERHNDNLRRLVEVELWPGEQLLWVGQPVPRVYAFARGELVKKALLLSGFAVLMFGYFALCSTPEVWYTRLEFLFTAFVGAFALVMGIGFIWFYQDAKGVVYAISSKRTLIFFLVSPVQLDTGRVRPWRVREQQGGTGDLLFPGRITFYAVPNLSEVTKLLQTHFNT
jgi:multisubunit Na+/H+ antiporter MnhG subunit